MKITPHVVAINSRPTTRVCVDDDKDYLKSLAKFLKYSGISCKMFTDSTKAMEYLHRAVKDHYWLKKCITIREHDDIYNKLKNRSITLDINKNKDIIYDPYRFLEVSCACFDHRMPGLTGVECLNTLQNFPFKKAMLSGRMMNEEAIDEFNKQTFDIFISKQAQDSSKEIAKNLMRAEQVYFKEHTKQLTEGHSKLSQVLLNPEFADFIDKYIDENNFCESYCIDDFGSLLLLNRDGKGVLLAVAHEDDIDAYLQTALMADKKPEADVIDKLKNKTAFPFFYSKDINNIEPADWKKFLFPATKIAGANIYYSIINDLKAYGIDEDKIVSYNSFLAKQDPFEFA